jgi:ATP-dependent protease Clp ATPase subunit
MQLGRSDSGASVTVQGTAHRKNALVKQYQRLFEMESIDLTLAEEALGE